MSLSARMQAVDRYMADARAVRRAGRRPHRHPAGAAARGDDRRGRAALRRGRHDPHGGAHRRAQVPIARCARADARDRGDRLPDGASSHRAPERGDRARRARHPEAAHGRARPRDRHRLHHLLRLDDAAARRSTAWRAFPRPGEATAQITPIVVAGGAILAASLASLQVAQLSFFRAVGPGPRRVGARRAGRVDHARAGGDGGLRAGALLAEPRRPRTPLRPRPEGRNLRVAARAPPGAASARLRRRGGVRGRARGRRVAAPEHARSASPRCTACRPMPRSGRPPRPSRGRSRPGCSPRPRSSSRASAPTTGPRSSGSRRRSAASPASPPSPARRSSSGGPT